MVNIVKEMRDETLFIILNRPHIGNAYDHDLSSSIKEAFLEADRLSDAKRIVLKSNGKNFCTGADLNWMRASASLSEVENLKDMSVIKEMYEAILSLKKPLATLVQGKVSGGGLGLVAASDFVIADESATFSLPEMRWGLIPGIISPIIKAKIGNERFKGLAESGLDISAQEAHDWGLIHHIGKMNLPKKIKCEDWSRFPNIFQEMNEMLIASANARQQMKKTP